MCRSHTSSDKMRDRSTCLRVEERCVVCKNGRLDLAIGALLSADAATSESTIETNVCILGPTRIGQVSFAER